MLSMLLGALAAAAMNGAVRHVSDDLHPFEISFFRVLFGLIVFSPLFLRHGMEKLKTRRIGLHIVRGGLQAGAMLQFFTALRFSPLAKVAALQFTTPLFGTIFALILLREAIRLRRVTALVVGIIGTLIILRPDVGGLDFGSGLVISSSASWAMAMIAIKVLSRADSSITITFYGTLFMLPFTLLAALPYWQTPTLEQLAWLAVVGGLASTHNLCVAQAFRDAEVTAVIPLDFSKLVWSAIIGYVFFAEVPVVWTWAGGVIILAAATYIAYREAQVKEEQTDHRGD